LMIKRELTLREEMILLIISQLFKRTSIWIKQSWPNYRNLYKARKSKESIL
jgi:hypothetical protein